MSEKERRDWDLNSKGEEYLDSLPKDQKELITKVVLTTMSACSEWTDKDIMFTEDVG